MIFKIGDGYYGKSVILRRVMFEEIERGYVVVFGDNIEANTNQLVELLNRISKDYPKILFIADNVHRTAGEAIFAAFNGIKLGKIRFLFAARENELDRNKPEIDRAFENIPKEAEYRVGFDLTDALLFMRQAINVTYEIDAEEADYKFAIGLYKFAKGDPFMFNLGIKYYLSESKKTYEDFVALDIEKKIKKLLKKKDMKDWKAPILCSILGIVGRSVSLQTSTGLLACSGIIPYSFESLVQQDFLIKQVEFKQEQYRVRHEKYAVEFLVYLYRTYFGNNPDLFDQTHGIRHIINCVWDNIISVDAIIDILEVCSSFYHIESYRPLSELITADYVVPYAKFVTPAHLSEPEKARLFCYGLGNLYSNRNDYIHSIEYYDQSIKIDSNFSSAWVNKGLSLANLGRYEEAITSYDKATEIKPDYASAWNNRGVSLDNLGRYEEAITSYDKATEINPNDAKAWNNKGAALGNLDRYEEAITSYDKAIEIKPDYADAWYNKGIAFDNLRRYEEAITSYDKATEINPNDADAWNYKAWIFANNNKNNEEALQIPIMILTKNRIRQMKNRIQLGAGGLAWLRYRRRHGGKKKEFEHHSP